MRKTPKFCSSYYTLPLLTIQGHSKGVVTAIMNNGQKLTPHRGPLAIHIAKTLPPEAQACCDEPLFRQALEAGGYCRKHGIAHNPWGLPLGQIVAVVWLDEVQRITPAFQVDETERSFGLFSPGRYGWLFSQVYRLAAPLSVWGSLGVWEWHPPAHFWSEIQAEYDRVLGGREDG